MALPGRVASTWLAGLIALLFTAVLLEPAQADIFMKIGGTPAAMGTTQTAGTLAGESTDPQYPGWTPLMSAQQGAGRGVSLGLGGTAVSTSSPTFSEVTITKLTDKTTPSLYVLLGGATATVTQPIDYVTIDIRKNGSQVFYRMLL